MMKTYTIRVMTKDGRKLDELTVKANWPSEALNQYEVFLKRNFISFSSIQCIDIDIAETDE